MRHATSRNDQSPEQPGRVRTTDRGSVTQGIEDLKGGRHDAAQFLWKRFFDRLAAKVRRQLGASKRRVIDDEDIALSVFDDFCRGASEGRFKDLTNRHDLWRLLLFMLRQRIVDHQRWNARIKRGGSATIHELQSQGVTCFNYDEVLASIASAEPPPELVASLNEQYRLLMNELSNAQLKEIAECVLLGYTSAEIAAKMGICERTVQRKVNLIRSKWAHCVT